MLKNTVGFELSMKMPSWNTYYAGVHWSKRKRKADELHNLVFCAAKALKKVKRVKQCNITVIAWYKGKRKHDPDNMYIKPFIDGLVMAGILPDDDCTVVKQISLRAINDCKEDKIFITLEVLR